MEGFAPQVLVAADITVGRRRPSGQHPVRAAYAGANAVGEEVHLPAAPGTYRFPAPHIPWDYR